MAKVLANLQQEADLLSSMLLPCWPVPVASSWLPSSTVSSYWCREATVQQMRETRRLLTLAKVPLIGYVFDPSRPSSRRRTGIRQNGKRRTRAVAAGHHEGSCSFTPATGSAVARTAWWRRRPSCCGVPAMSPSSSLRTTRCQPRARPPLSSPHNPTLGPGVRGAIVAFRPDVAHLHNTWYAMSPSVVEELRRAQVPVVMTVHNYRLACLGSYFLRDGRPCEDCLGRSPWAGVQHRCYHDSVLASTAAAATLIYNRRRGTGRGVALFLAPTAFVRDRLVAGGLPAARVRVKPHFVVDPGPRADPPSRSRTVLYVGRLSPDKGTRPVDAWSALRTSDLELVCVGDGPLRDEMSRRGNPASADARRRPACRGEERDAARPGARRSIDVVRDVRTRRCRGDGGGAARRRAQGRRILQRWRGKLLSPIPPCPTATPRAWSSSKRCSRYDDDQNRPCREFGRARFVSSFRPEAGLAELIDAYTVAASSARTGAAASTALRDE